MILSQIGIIITFSSGLIIHILEGSPGWYIVIICSFLLLMKGLHNIYTFFRRKVRCYHLNILRQKRKSQQNAKSN